MRYLIEWFVIKSDDVIEKYAITDTDENNALHRAESTFNYLVNKHIKDPLSAYQEQGKRNDYISCIEGDTEVWVEISTYDEKVGTTPNSKPTFKNSN